MLIFKRFFSTIIFLIVVINIQAQEINDGEKLQILAKVIETKDNIVTATKDVLIHSPNYYITAQKVIYDKNASTLELFDNVNIIKNGQTIIFTEYALLDFNKEIDVFTPILQIEGVNNVWINSKKADKKSELLSFDSSTLSSCDCYDPAWSISFTSGDYNITKQWLNTYNTTLFINEIPIFYTPYFGFPTDKTRRTGLLKPTIGWSNIEGLLYAQPIYYAPKLNYDFEYVPQVRTKRGKGHQLKYRLKDSSNSLLTMEGGLFKEDIKYSKQIKLRNKEHYGWDLKYEKTKLFSSKRNQDGLLVSLHDLNDIDYINTKYDNEATSTDKLLESKLKYFYNTNQYYSSIDMKYYKNTSYTSKQQHNTTMQELPKIHLHQYSNKTFFDNLLYATDIKYSRKTRIDGLKAKKTDMFVPLTYSRKLLDDYLNIAYSEQITLIDIKYGNNTNNYKNGQFIENKHIISLSTDLLKPYNNYIHTINLKTSLTVPEVIKKDGDLYSITNTDSDLSIFPVTKTQKNIAFTFNQSIYDKNNLSQIINHKINQSILYDEQDKSRLAPLENDFTYYYKYGSLSNRILFNHQEHLIISSATTSKFKKDNNFLNIYHTQSKEKPALNQLYKDMKTNETIKYDIGTSFLKYYKVSYDEEYDLTNNVSKKKEYVFNINKKCWAIDFKLVDNLVASSTLNNKAQRQNILYMQFVLKPIVQLNQKYIQDIREE